MLSSPIFPTDHLHLQTMHCDFTLEAKSTSLNRISLLFIWTCYLNKRLWIKGTRIVLYPGTHWCDLRSFDDSHCKHGTFVAYFPYLKYSWILIVCPRKINLILHVHSLSKFFIFEKINLFRFSEKNNYTANGLAPNYWEGCFTQRGQKAAPWFVMQSLYCFARYKICTDYRCKCTSLSLPLEKCTTPSRISMEKGSSNSCLKSKSNMQF